MKQRKKIIKMKHINYVLLVLVVLGSIACINRRGGEVPASSKQKKLMFRVGAIGAPEEGIFILEDGNRSKVTESGAEDFVFVNDKMVRVNACYTWLLNDQNKWDSYHVKYPKSESYFSSCVNTSEVVVIDSMATTHGWATPGYTLLGYDSKLKEKLFSVYITKDNFRVTKYSPMLKQAIIAIPDYYHLSSGNAGFHEFKLLDLENEQQIQLAKFTIGGRDGDQYESVLPHSDKEMMVAFDVKYIRNEGDGKLSISKVYYGNTTQEPSYIQIEQIDYINNTTKELLFATLPKGVPSTFHCHQFYKDRIFISTKDKILEYVDGQWETQFELGFRGEILDFVPIK